MSLKSLLGDALPTAANNLLANVSTKYDEAAKKVKDTIGGVGGFDKLAAKAPTFAQNAAAQAVARAELKAADATGMVTSQIDAKIREGASLPSVGTVLDAGNATANDEAANQTDELSAATIKAASAAQQNDTEHMVKLVEKNGTQVLFRVMPEVVESRTVEYEAIAPPQHLSAFQKYKGTSSTQWSVNATLTCRTITEATENLRIINVLRGWTMPFFGTRTAEYWPNKLGAPPPVLTFSGWRSQMVGPVQVVVTSLNWNFPQDVDYIPAREFKVAPDTEGAPGNYFYTGKLVPFPTVIKLQIQLVESFSTEQMNGFNLNHFRAGQMLDAFRPLPRSDRTDTVPASTTPPVPEAQSPPPTSFSGIRTEIAAGLPNGPAVPPIVAQAGGVAGTGMVTELRRASQSEVRAIDNRIQSGIVEPFVSGGGGDFGGGSASGDF